jgi:hypothetical protein
MPYPNYHAVRIKDPDLFEPDSMRTKTLDSGIMMIMGKLKDGSGSMVVQAYRFPKDKFSPDEVKAWLKKYDIKDHIKFEPAKEDLERTPDYLEKFLELIKPYIYPAKWDECHLAARSYAGGKASGRKKQILLQDTEISVESIQIGPGILRREGRFLVVPVHLTHEGVANGTLKRWNEIYDPDEVDGVNSFEGCPITRSHPPIGRADETTLTLGRLRNVKVDMEKKRADCEAWLVEKRLTGTEKEALESGQPVRGSLGYLSRKKYYADTKFWDDGSAYTTEILKPFFGDHYALLNEIEDPACPTCGFNVLPQTESVDTESDIMMTNCPYENNPAPSPEDGVDIMETENTPAKPEINIEALLKEGIEKANASLLEKIASLENRLETYETEVAAKAKKDAEALDLERKTAFAKMLKPAFSAEVDKYYLDAKAMGESLWFAANPDKMQVQIEKRSLKGTGIPTESTPFDLAQAQKDLFKY